MVKLTPDTSLSPYCFHYLLSYLSYLSCVAHLLAFPLQKRCDDITLRACRVILERRLTVSGGF